MTDVFSQEEQVSLYFTAPTCIVKQRTSCVVQLLMIFFKYKHVNLVEMAKKRKCDNNSNSSDQNRAHKTYSFQTKLDILKHYVNREGHGEIARFFGLSCSTMSIAVKNIVKIVEHVKGAGSLQSVLVNPKRSVLIEEMEHLLKIWLDNPKVKHTP
jgi:hypothetical protein